MARRTLTVLVSSITLAGVAWFAAPGSADATVPAATARVAVTAHGWSASDATRDRLGAGKVIVETAGVSGSEYPMFRGYAVIDATPEQVWAIVEDCAHYDRNLARIESSRLIRASGGVVRCETILDFPAPFANARVVSDAVHRTLPGHRFEREWSFVEGDFDENRGRWSILPFDEAATRSLVVYETHAEPHAAIPPGILKLAQQKAMPNLFKKLRAAI